MQQRHEKCEEEEGFAAKCQRYIKQQKTKDTHLSAARRHRSALRLTEGGVEQAFQRENGGGDLGAREAHVPIDAAGHSVECGVSCKGHAPTFLNVNI